jgi:Repeat of unknown function (DUF5907)
MQLNKSLFFILISLIGFQSLGQANKKTINYQAVILDPKAIDLPGANITGQPLNKGKVCLRFSLLNSSGALEFEETHQVMTDEYGLVNVSIGTGSPSASTSIYKSFENVTWNSNVKSLKVSVSYDACTSFVQVSSQMLNYTPYALYADVVDYKNVREAPTKLSQFSNDAGYLIPKDLDPIKSDIKENTSQISITNKTVSANKQASDAAFLVVNQSVSSLDKLVADHTNSIANVSSRIEDQQNQIAATNNALNSQIGGLQGQINSTNSNVNNLSGAVEVLSNKSIATDLGGSSPSDQLYPSQKATKAYVDVSIFNAVGSGVPDATTLAAGKIKLAGDLGGTASNPTVPGLTNKEDITNKSLNVQADGTNNTKYPSVKAVKDYVDQATQGTALTADLAAKANINSPTFTGTPVLPTGTTAVTQASGDNSTKLATTAYVDAQISAGSADASSSTKGIVKLAGDLGGTAASPSVVKLRGTTISATAPASTGQVLAYDGAGSAAWATPSVAANAITGILPIANGGTGTNNGSISGTSALSFTAGGTNQNIELNPSGSGKLLFNGNVGIGTANPLANAALDITSTTQMFYPPRMTSTQRDAIANPTSGGVIYNTSLKRLQVYNESSLGTEGTGYFGSNPIYDSPYQGQTFQPLNSGVLKSIKASVSNRNSVDEYIQVKIYDAPNGNLLATADATFRAPAPISTFNFVTGTWTFNNSSLVLNANTTYYVEFNSNYNFFIGTTNNSYPRGTLYKGTTHSNVASQANYDIDCLISYGDASSWDVVGNAVTDIAHGGTGAITQQAAINALTGTQSSGKYLRSDGTDAKLSTIQVADIPTLNQNTTGTAANVTGTVAVANGGTGLTTVGTSGQVLKSNGSSIAWGNPVPSAVFGVLSANPQSITVVNSGGSSELNTGAYITLPPGKWSVNITMLANCYDISTCTTGSWWIRFGFSTSSSSRSTNSTDFPVNTLVSGSSFPNNYGIIQGAFVINNTTGANKTYYLWTSNCDLIGGNGSSTIRNIAFNGNGENLIIAYPMY